MSDVISDEQSSTAYDLSEEIDKKLTQARGICGALQGSVKEEGTISDSIWAAADLIEEGDKFVQGTAGYWPEEGGAIMSDVMDSTDDPERFSPLMCRLESVLHRLKLAADALH